MAPLRVGLVLRIAPLLLVACGLVEAAPLVAPSGLVATAGLAATMDPSEGAIVHDDGQRRSPPPEALRRRVYSVVPSFVRWSWRAELSFPVDRVALVGSPPPLPGQRFVLFDEDGPFGLVEATGERCPPGHDDCVVCEVDDPARRHWARYVGVPPPGPPRWGSALGPFAADEPVPEPRSVYGIWQSRGLWTVGTEADLDGDGRVDRVRALHDCRPGRPNHPRCRMQDETWRLHDGRWFAEPRVSSPPAPMHLLSLVLSEVTPGVRSAMLSSWFDPFNRREPPGDYAIVTRRGVAGMLRHVDGAPAWCLIDGDGCQDLDRMLRTKRRLPEWALVVGPVPGGVRLRVQRTRDVKSLWSGWGVPMLVVERDDGRRWVVTMHSCQEVAADGVESHNCYEVREDGGGPALRWLTMASRGTSEPVCGRLAEPPPIAGY